MRSQKNSQTFQSRQRRYKKTEYRKINSHERARRLAKHYYKERQLCSSEGCLELGQRHHIDYTKPLDIVWLCHQHHLRIHSLVT